MANNERNAGRKPIVGGKQRRITCTDEEHKEIKSLLKEIRNKAKKDE